eukprot:361917-Chlamydomonas_euryale.AAC.15
MLHPANKRTVLVERGCVRLEGRGIKKAGHTHGTIEGRCNSVCAHCVCVCVCARVHNAPFAASSLPKACTPNALSARRAWSAAAYLKQLLLLHRPVAQRAVERRDAVPQRRHHLCQVLELRVHAGEPVRGAVLRGVVVVEREGRKCVGGVKAGSNKGVRLAPACLSALDGCMPKCAGRLHAQVGWTAACPSALDGCMPKCAGQLHARVRWTAACPSALDGCMSKGAGRLHVQRRWTAACPRRQEGSTSG